MVDLIREFLNETRDNLARMDADVLALEREPHDQQRIARIFRVLHTIKSSCGFLKLPLLEEAARYGEHMLGMLRDGVRPVTGDAVALILAIVDIIRTITAHLESAGKEPADCDLSGLQKAVAAFTETGETTPLEPIFSSLADMAYDDSGVRLPIEKLEELMNRMAELSLARNDLRQDAHRSRDMALRQKMQRLHMRIDALQECILQTRMQPVRHLWKSLPRIVHDAAKTLSKDIQLVMTGQDTEMDKQILDHLKEPFIHLIRNAVDHGIEPPEMRVRQGKPRTGTIALHAVPSGGRIILSVEDDGKGLDIDAIRRHAVAKNLVAEDVPFTAQTARQLLFTPGFSTAPTVTDLSGRGVGLDVVHTQIEKIGGAIDVDFEQGRYCRFLLNIPLTLAIVPAVMVAGGAQIFALLQSAVVELLRLKTDSPLLEKSGEDETLQWRGHLLPLVRLTEKLNLPPRHPPNRHGHIVILDNGTRRFALLTEGILFSEDIIIKPLPRALKKGGAFSGLTLLGDGRATLILNPAFLSAGIETPEKTTTTSSTGNVLPVHASGEPHLVFSASPGNIKAVPLRAIERLERFPAAAIEWNDTHAAVAYQNGILPLLPYTDEAPIKRTGRQCVLVMRHQDIRIGLCVETINGITQDLAACHPPHPAATMEEDTCGLALMAHETAHEIVDIVDLSRHVTRLLNATPKRSGGLL